MVGEYITSLDETSFESPWKIYGTMDSKTRHIDNTWSLKSLDHYENGMKIKRRLR